MQESATDGKHLVEFPWLIPLGRLRFYALKPSRSGSEGMEWVQAASASMGKPAGADGFCPALELGAELEEEAVVVVAGGALAVAGAEVQLQATIQLVAEAGAVGVAAVG